MFLVARGDLALLAGLHFDEAPLEVLDARRVDKPAIFLKLRLTRPTRPRCRR